MELEPSQLSQLTLKQKIARCSGADFWHSKPFPEQGIPSFTISDGPHGLRHQTEEADMLGLNNSRPATCFPTAVTAGATWNPALYAAEGAAIGCEAAAFVQGQQSAGVASCLKHFAANNQEFKRNNGDSLVDPRTLRELYLAPFE